MAGKDLGRRDPEQEHEKGASSSGQSACSDHSALGGEDTDPAFRDPALYLADGTGPEPDRWNRNNADRDVAPEGGDAEPQDAKLI
jgi:hypothetical protein